MLIVFLKGLIVGLGASIPLGPVGVLCIQKTLSPLGVAVVIEAQHMCMSMRGVQKQNSVTTTSSFYGAFMKDSKTREEFMHLIGVNLH